MPQLISLFNVQPLAAELAKQTLCLTPNQRLASRIVNAYAIYCHQHGHTVVAAPRVSSFNQWLDNCWEQLVMMAYPQAIIKQLLTANEQRLIIERIIMASEVGGLLLRPSATVQHVVKAIENLSQWMLDINEISISSQFNTDDSLCLLQWLRDFESHCDINGYISPSHKSQLILQAFKEGVLVTEPCIITTAFETLTPLQQHILEAAADVVKQEEVVHAAKATQKTIACINHEQEITVAALWAKQQLKNAIDSQKMPTIAIVIPDLNQNKEKVQRIFEEIFMPDLQMPDVARVSLPFNISAGGALIEQPIIASAIKLLELNARSINCDELVELLHSPFLCFSDEDLSFISKLIGWVKRERTTRINIARLRQLTSKLIEKKTDDEEASNCCFADALMAQNTLSTRFGLSKSISIQQWVDFFYETFELYQWPGIRNPDSQEYQALKQFQQITLQFAQSDVVMGKINFNEALQQYKQLLSNAVFQPQTIESPLQILGLLEASGLHFDQLWLMGMSSKQWPASPNPNPLLPVAMQKKFNMPHSTASRELSLAQHLSNRFCHSAQHVYVSFSQVIDDNPCSISPLFNDMEQLSPEQVLNKTVDSLLPQHEIYRRYQVANGLEDFEWGDAPPLTEAESIKGGTSLFANQSLCPFKAFATHRLSIKAFEKPVVGIDKSAKGNLLHRSLELIWKQITNLNELRALTDDEQTKLCTDYAEFSLNEYSHKLSEPLGIRLHKIESQRLASLLFAWLNVERERADFTVVSREERKIFRFAQLELIGRVDRVDQLSDGSHVVIDYKTGKPAIKSWWGDRPEQPQLPLYSSLLEQEGIAVSAVAFAQVNIEACVIKGIGDDNVAEKTLSWNAKTQSQAGVQSWAHLKEHWQQVLSSLANDFIAGKSAVDPKSVLASCQYCDLAPVCRVNHESSPSDIEVQG